MHRNEACTEYRDRPQFAWRADILYMGLSHIEYVFEDQYKQYIYCLDAAASAAAALAFLNEYNSICYSVAMWFLAWMQALP